MKTILQSHLRDGSQQRAFLAVTDPQFQILSSSNNLEGQMLPPDIINAINQDETEQWVAYTVSDDENAALKLVYMEWLNQNRRIVLTKAISVEDGSVSKQQRNIEFDR